MYSSLTLSTFRLVCSRHYHLSLKFFSLSLTKILCLLNTSSIPHPYPHHTPGNCHSTFQLIQLSVSLNQTSRNIEGLSFCDWLILLSIMSPRFIQVVDVSEFPSFLRLKSIPFYGWTTFLICSFNDRPWRCFHILAVVSNAAVNVCVQIYF